LPPLIIFCLIRRRLYLHFAYFVFFHAVTLYYGCCRVIIANTLMLYADAAPSLICCFDAVFLRAYAAAAI